MLERDDEDLAIDQLAARRARRRPTAHPTPRGRAAAGAGSRARRTAARGAGPRPPLREMRDELERLRAQLQSLPTGELTQLDELDARTRTLTERRDLLRSELDRLPAPRERRFGRGEDPHLVDRTRLSSALAGAEDQLERTLTQRATLGRQLGDVAGIRDERDALTNATDRLQREHTELRNELAEREVAERPAWTREALGERPERAIRRSPLGQRRAYDRPLPHRVRDPRRRRPARTPTRRAENSEPTTSARNAHANNSPANSDAKHPATNSTSAEAACRAAGFPEMLPRVLRI